jgi:hypothetical protein
MMSETEDTNSVDKGARQYFTLYERPIFTDLNMNMKSFIKIIYGWFLNSAYISIFTQQFFYV